MLWSVSREEECSTRYFPPSPLECCLATTKKKKKERKKEKRKRRREKNGKRFPWPCGCKRGCSYSVWDLKKDHPRPELQLRGYCLISLTMAQRNTFGNVTAPTAVCFSGVLYLVYHICRLLQFVNMLLCSHMLCVKQMLIMVVLWC